MVLSRFVRTIKLHGDLISNPIVSLRMPEKGPAANLGMRSYAAVFSA